MTISISNKEIGVIAGEFGLDPALVKAVLLVESSGSGFDSRTDKIIIQFESHWFERFTKTKILNGVEGQAKEWEAFAKAYEINKDAAMKSTSWGLGQIMGFNHKQAGYKTVQEMVDDFKISEANQLRGMLHFVASNPTMMRSLKKRQFSTFASFYNGKNYKKFNYDTRLSSEYLKAKTLNYA